jgi:hypothetical protein
MKLNSMKTFQLFCFQFLFILFAHAQVDHAFLKHLGENNLRQEHWTYLSNLSGSTDADSVNYLKTKYHLQYFNDSVFIEFYSKSKNIFDRDTSSFAIASVEFLDKEKSAFRTTWFSSHSDEVLSENARMIYYCYLAGVDPMKVDEKKLPKNIRHDFIKYRKSYGKKPFVAGALSMVVPGLGKLYVGRKQSFYSTFLSHLVYGVQNYEVISKLGVKNPVSIFSMGFLGVFYISNIVGSYNDANKVKKENRTQFLKNAATYYHHTHPFPLYR